VNLGELDPTSDDYLLDETDGIFLASHQILSVFFVCMCGLVL